MILLFLLIFLLILLFISNLLFLFISNFLSLLNWQKDLSEQIRHRIVEAVELLICFLNHIVDGSHDLRSIIFTFFHLEDNHPVSTDLTDHIVLCSSLVIDEGNFRSQRYVRVFNLGLRVLRAQEIENANRS
jgi:hypothetical protein